MSNSNNNKFPRGSEWHKWDLHVHSPATYGGKYSEFIKNINNAEADVIGINDYCTIHGYEQVLSSSEVKLQKPVFPVVEFRMNNIVLDKDDPRLKAGARINFHVIFDNDESLIPRIKTWLNALDCIHKSGKSEKLGNIDVRTDALKITFDYLRVVQSLEDDDRLSDRFLIWLPYDEYGGIDNIDPDNDGYFKLGLINKARIIGSANKKQIEFFVWNSNKHTEDNIKNWLNGRKLPCIKGSDAHSINYPFGRLRDDKSQPIEKYCWIKADLTFEGLKEILYEPEPYERVIISENNPALYDHAVVDLFSVSNQNEKFFLRTIDVCYLNPGLNCIIGSRGSGKSTFLDALALTLGDVRVLEKKRNNYIGYFFQDNDSSILNASVKHSSTGDEEVLLPKTSKSSGFQFDYYHQKHIGFLCDPNNEDILSRFLFDKIFQEDTELSMIFEHLTRKQDSCRSNLAVNRQKVVACEQDITKEKDVTEKIEDKRGRVRFLSKRAIKKLLDERSTVIKLKERMSQIRTRLEEIEDDPIVRDANSIDLEFFKHLILSDLDPEGTILSDEWRELEKNSKTIIDSLDSDRESLGSKVDKLTDDVRKLEPSFDFESQLDTIFVRIEQQSKKEHITISKIDLDKLDAIQKEIVGLENQLAQIKEKKVEKAGLLEERQRLLRNYINHLDSVKQKLENSFEQLLKGDASILKGTIQLEIETVLPEHTCLESIQEHAKHNLDDLPNFPNRKFLLELFIAQGQSKIVDAFRKSDFTHWNVRGLGKRSLDYFSKIQNKEEVAMHLEELLPELTSKLLWRPDTSREFKYLKNCSIGERGTALLSVILVTGKEPLVIDQPEDDLDHYFLYRTLTPIIKYVKRNRQLIFATHDANIVINGDAELIIIVSTSDGAFGTITPTTVENLSTREKMLEILEGGKDAFKQRRQKYGNMAN